MANPVLTQREKAVGIYGAVSWTITQAKAYTNFSNLDSAFIQNTSTDPTTFAEYIFINSTTSISDAPGILINVTSGGFLVNKLLFPTLITSALESQLISQFPSTALSGSYNTDTNKFRAIYPSVGAKDLVTYGTNIIQVNQLSDFGSISGSTINIPTGNFLFIVTEDLDLTGYTFQIPISTSVIISSYSNVTLNTGTDSVTNSIFILGDAASLYLYNMNMEVTRNLVNALATNSSLYIDRSSLQFSALFTGARTANINITNSYLYPGFHTGSSTSNIINASDSGGIGLFNTYINNNVITIPDTYTFLNISNCHINDLVISNNVFNIGGAGSLLINATSYTNMNGHINYINGNIFKGNYINMTTGVSLTDYTWLFNGNIGANDLGDTDYAFVQSNNNSGDGSNTAISIANTFTPVLYGPSTIYPSNLRGFQLVTSGSPTRLQITSKSPYTRNQILTISLQLSYTASASQLFTFSIYKNGTQIPNVVSEVISSVFTENPNGIANTTFSCPISHISGDILELYVTCPATISLKIQYAQYSIS